MGLALKTDKLAQSPPSLLLVEDNIADAKLFTKLFEESGFTGTLNWVCDGAQALDYVFRRGKFVGANPPELIFLDLNLPKVDGWEVLEQLGRHEETKSIPIIVLTTSNRQEDIKKCLEKGAACIFTKPSELQEFRTMIARLNSVEFPKRGVGTR